MPARHMAACLLAEAWRQYSNWQASLPREQRQDAELRFIDAATRLAVVEAGMNPYAPSLAPRLRGEE